MFVINLIIFTSMTLPWPYSASTEMSHLPNCTSFTFTYCVCVQYACVFTVCVYCECIVCIWVHLLWVYSVCLCGWICMGIHTHVCTVHVCVCVCTCVCIDICVSRCVFVYVCMCIFMWYFVYWYLWVYSQLLFFRSLFFHSRMITFLFFLEERYNPVESK